MAYDVSTMSTSQVIAATDLERETGLGKDLLRKWRSRYGFPTPIRLGDGSNGYPKDQVAQLRLIKRLQDSGFRPAQIVGKPLADLDRMASAMACASCTDHWSPFTRNAIEYLKQHDLRSLQKSLAETRAQTTLTDFVQKTVAPLTVALGEAWARNEIEVYQEHICTDILVRQLHADLDETIVIPGAPKILFATPHDEHHVLGILMAQAVLSDLGADCISVGAHIPVEDLSKAVLACQSDILALSFSFSYPKRRIRPLLLQLRKLLPLTVEIWAGGAGAEVVKRPPKGIRIFTTLQGAAGVLAKRIAQDKGAG